MLSLVDYDFLNSFTEGDRDIFVFSWIWERPYNQVLRGIFNFVQSFTLLIIWVVWLLEADVGVAILEHVDWIGSNAIIMIFFLHFLAETQSETE